jgi:hypothetical protein
MFESVWIQETWRLGYLNILYRIYDLLNDTVSSSDNIAPNGWIISGHMKCAKWRGCTLSMWLEITRNVSEHPVPVKSLTGALHRYKSQVLVLAEFMGIMNRKIPRMAPAAASHFHCFSLRITYCLWDLWVFNLRSSHCKLLHCYTSGVSL